MKIVSIVDEQTRECLGGLVERWVSADRLIDELDRIAVQRGYPAALRCDNGPELAATRWGTGWTRRAGIHPAGTALLICLETTVCLYW